MCLSGSNSTIERALSLLSLVLSDRRLRMGMAQNTVANIIVINVNKLWTPHEKEMIIESAAKKI